MQLLNKNIFGPNVELDENDNLIVHKEDLGLSSTEYSAEILFAAIFRKVQENFFGHLTDPIGEAVTDPDGHFIHYDNSDLYFSLQISLWNKQLRNLRYRHIFVCEYIAL